MLNSDNSQNDYIAIAWISLKVNIIKITFPNWLNEPSKAHIKNHKTIENPISAKVKGWNDIPNLSANNDGLAIKKSIPFPQTEDANIKKAKPINTLPVAKATNTENKKITTTPNTPNNSNINYSLIKYNI